MNYKVVLAWIAAGLLAYIAGRSANIGLQVFSGTLALVLLIVGISELDSLQSKEEEKAIIQTRYFTPAIKPRKVAKKKVARRGTITLKGMSKKERQKIYNARYHAKKKLSKK